MEVDTNASDSQQMAIDDTNLNSNLSMNGCGSGSGIEDIIKCLVLNEDVVFKSQQRGEEDPDVLEKTKIANEIFAKSPANFLNKFGKHLKENELKLFKDVIKDEDCDILCAILLKNIESKNKKNDVLKKNRRYEMLQLLIEGNSYFSELEMMKRNPVLYDQLIGQYLSEDERRIRDRCKPAASSFVTVLMDGIDKEEAENRMNELEGDGEDEESDSSDGGNSEENGISENNGLHIPEIQNVDKNTKWGEYTNDKNKPGEPSTSSCSSQIRNSFNKWNYQSPQNKLALRNNLNNGPRWGEFNSANNIVNHFNNRNQKRKSLAFNKHLMITSEERALLREEFTSIMYQSFLEGKDDFDYDSVDNNDSYDNINLVNYDEEEKYFDAEEPEEVTEGEDVKVEKMDDSSEDELDIYMNALNQHPTVCQLAKDMKKL